MNVSLCFQSIFKFYEVDFLLFFPASWSVSFDVTEKFRALHFYISFWSVFFAVKTVSTQVKAHPRLHRALVWARWVCLPWWGAGVAVAAGLRSCLWESSHNIEKKKKQERKEKGFMYTLLHCCLHCSFFAGLSFHESESRKSTAFSFVWVPWAAQSRRQRGTRGRRAKQDEHKEWPS